MIDIIHKYRYIIYILSFFLGVTFGGALKASAETIVDQPIRTDVELVQNVVEWTGVTLQIPLGTGLSGFYENIGSEIYIQDNHPTDLSFQFNLSEYDDSLLTSPTGNTKIINFPATTNGFEGIVTGTSTGDYTFNSSKYYALEGTSGVSFLSRYGVNSIDNFYYSLFGDVAFNDKLVILDPENSTTTSSTTVNFVIEYDNREVNYPQIEVVVKSTYTFENIVSFRYFDLISATGTIQFTSVLDEGIYAVEAQYYRASDDSVQYFDRNDFTVVESQLDDILGFDPTDYESIAGLATTTCNLSNISGCFQNALIFTFYPTPDALQNFENLKDIIANKAPFGYFTLISDELSGLSDSATPAFALDIEDNIDTNIFQPLKTGLATVLWFLFALWIYKRLTKVTL